MLHFNLAVNHIYFRTYESGHNATSDGEHFDQTLPTDVKGDFKATIKREGLMLLHNGTGKFILII